MVTWCADDCVSARQCEQGVVVDAQSQAGAAECVAAPTRVDRQALDGQVTLQQEQVVGALVVAETGLGQGGDQPAGGGQDAALADLRPKLTGQARLPR